MGRRILAVILLVVAISIAIITPVLAYTPIGASLLSHFTSASPADTSSPPPIPFTPTPWPKPTPILTVVGVPPPLHVKTAYLLDANTNMTLDDFHGEIPLPMASTTKIMTAIIAIQTGNLDQVITIHQDAINEVINNGGSSAQLAVGDQVRLKDLLYGLLLPSGDDAAVAIADGISGSTDNFVHVMNIFAYRLRLFQTHYSNPDGLPAFGHYTTAFDLVRLAQYAMNNKMFAQIVKTGYYNLAASSSHHAYKWVNTNDLLGTNPKEFPAYPGTTGIKTGHTDEAGYCLVFSATHNGHDLIGVVLFDTDTDPAQRFRDAKTLLDWGFGLPLRVPI